MTAPPDPPPDAAAPSPDDTDRALALLQDAFPGTVVLSDLDRHGNRARPAPKRGRYPAMLQWRHDGVWTDHKWRKCIDHARKVHPSTAGQYRKRGQGDDGKVRGDAAVGKFGEWTVWGWLNMAFDYAAMGVTGANLLSAAERGCWGSPLVCHRRPDETRQEARGKSFDPDLWYLNGPPAAHLEPRQLPMCVKTCRAHDDRRDSESWVFEFGGGQRSRDHNVFAKGVDVPEDPRSGAIVALAVIDLPRGAVSADSAPRHSGVVAAPQVSTLHEYGLFAPTRNTDLETKRAVYAADLFARVPVEKLWAGPFALTPAAGRRWDPDTRGWTA